MSTVVVAPDSFKGSASAAKVASAVRDGWLTARPQDTVTLAPLADGGEGTLDAFALAYPDARRMPLTVTGPDDRAVEACWLLLPGGVGVVELASTSGLTLQDGLHPMTAHTRGFGQAIAAALDHGVDRLLLALGGSSSTDGGSGALTELGARFLGRDGMPLPSGGASLADLAQVDVSGLRSLPPRGVVVLCDVTNPVLGPTGAAHVFGPQKGANAAEVVALDAGLARLAALLPADRRPSVDAPGAGAAGGTAYGLLAWGATVEGGAQAVGDALGIPHQLAHADLVITGEGRFDSQSMAGKVPSYVVGVAAQAGVPAALVAGSVNAPTERFAAVASLADLAGSVDAAIAMSLPWLREAGSALARAVDLGSA